MNSVAELQKAIEQLPAQDRAVLSVWLQSREEPILTARQEAALLAGLDQAAAELDAGLGVPVATVREQVAKWTTR